MNKLLLIALCFLAVSKLTSSHPHPHNEDYQQHYHSNDEVPIVNENYDKGPYYFGQWTIEDADEEHTDYFTKQSPEDVEYEFPDDDLHGSDKFASPAAFVRDQNGVFRTSSEDGPINYDEAFS